MNDFKIPNPIAIVEGILAQVSHTLVNFPFMHDILPEVLIDFINNITETKHATHYVMLNATNGTLLPVVPAKKKKAEPPGFDLILAILGATTTALASTDFVQKRMKPEEYEAKKEKERIKAAKEAMRATSRNALLESATRDPAYKINIKEVDENIVIAEEVPDVDRTALRARGSNPF